MMLALVLQRLEDWEYDSQLGYVSSIGKHGIYVTYANNFNSYINDTTSGNISVLFTSEEPNSMLTAIYDDIQVTYSASDKIIHTYMNYTWINNVTDKEETIWQEVEAVKLRNANAKALNLYQDLIAYQQATNTLFYKYKRQNNAYNESVPANTVQMGEATANMWQFISVVYNKTETPYILFFQSADSSFYAINTTGTTPKTILITIPELAGIQNPKLLYCNSSEATDMMIIQLQNSSVVTIELSFDMERMQFEYKFVSIIDLSKEIFPLIGLDDIASYNGIPMYITQHILLYKNDYLAVYSLLNDSTVYYKETSEEKNEYSIQLIRLQDKKVFNLSVDQPPAYIYSDCYSVLYLMGTQDQTISGYFSIDMNGLIEPCGNQRFSCWTISSKLNIAYDPGNLKITAELLNSADCDSLAPQSIVYNGFSNSQAMKKTVYVDDDGGETVVFSVTLEFSPQSTYELQMKGAVGHDDDGMLVSDVVIGELAADDSTQSCWMLDDALALSFDNNLLTVIVSEKSGCSLDEPIVTAVPQTNLSEEVPLAYIGLPSPSDDQKYYYFFDPEIETFSNKIKVEFYIELISPSGEHVGKKTKAASKDVDADMESCWNIEEYRGMCYNYDHFELLRWDQIWSNRTAKLCEPRVTFDEVYIEFSYKVKGTKSLNLTEKDFKVLPNGRMAYFVNVDVYEDWISSTVKMKSKNKAVPYIGDSFVVNGTYNIGKVEPDSCFEFLDICSVEYDNNNKSYVTVDHEFWCKDAEIDPAYHILVYEYNLDPDEDGDFPYCNMTWDSKNKRYRSTGDCELKIGAVANLTIVESKSFINEHDEWEDGDVVIYTALKTVADFSYNYTYIILISVFGAAIFLMLLIGAFWWYYRRFLPQMHGTVIGAGTQGEHAGLMQNQAELGQDDLCEPPAMEAQKPPKEHLFSKKNKEKAFGEELFKMVPAPPTKQ